MITMQEALTANNFEHATYTNADGTPCRARRNGKTETWKTRPNDFRIPAKLGFNSCFYITNYSHIDWNIA